MVVPVIKVLFVDDNQDLVKILQMAIRVEPDLQSVGSLSRADELLSKIEETKPDVVLLDIRMPGKDPIEAVREIVPLHPHTKFLLFTGYEDPSVIERGLRAGASGVISKDNGFEEIALAIRQAVSQTKTMNA